MAEATPTLEQLEAWAAEDSDRDLDLGPVGVPTVEQLEAWAAEPKPEPPPAPRPMPEALSMLVPAHGPAALREIVPPTHEVVPPTLTPYPPVVAPPAAAAGGVSPEIGREIGELFGPGLQGVDPREYAPAFQAAAYAREALTPVLRETAQTDPKAAEVSEERMAVWEREVEAARRDLMAERGIVAVSRGTPAEAELRAEAEARVGPLRPRVEFVRREANKAAEQAFVGALIGLQAEKQGLPLEELDDRTAGMLLRGAITTLRSYGFIPAGTETPRFGGLWGEIEVPIAEAERRGLEARGWKGPARPFAPHPLAETMAGAAGGFVPGLTREQIGRLAGEPRLAAPDPEAEAAAATTRGGAGLLPIGWIGRVMRGAPLLARVLGMAAPEAVRAAAEAGPEAAAEQYEHAALAFGGMEAGGAIAQTLAGPAVRRITREISTRHPYFAAGVEYAPAAVGQTGGILLPMALSGHEITREDMAWALLPLVMAAHGVEAKGKAVDDWLKRVRREIGEVITIDPKTGNVRPENFGDVVDRLNQKRAAFRRDFWADYERAYDPQRYSKPGQPDPHEYMRARYPGVWPETAPTEAPPRPTEATAPTEAAPPGPPKALAPPPAPAAPPAEAPPAPAPPPMPVAAPPEAPAARPGPPEPAPTPAERPAPPVRPPGAAYEGPERRADAETAAELERLSPADRAEILGRPEAELRGPARAAEPPAQPPAEAPVPARAEPAVPKPGQAALAPAPTEGETARWRAGTPEQNAETLRAGGRPEEGTVILLRPQDIVADPERFQFRRGATKEGVTVGGVLGKYEPKFVGVIDVTVDPTGQALVVNGHHRLAKAKEAGAPEIRAQVLYFDSDEQARYWGALKNIADGNASAVDAARVLRESKAAIDDLKAAGISPRSVLVRQAAGLARLGDALFHRVATGDMEPEIGAAIGGRVEDPYIQSEIARAVDEATAKGKAVTPGFVTQLADRARDLGVTKETVQDLFGEHEIRRSLLLETAQVQEAVEKLLNKRKNLFHGVSKKGAEEILREAGNVIDTTSSAEAKAQTEQIIAVFDKLKNAAGTDVSRLVRDAAVEVQRGTKPGPAAEAIFPGIVRAVRAALEGAEGRGPREAAPSPEPAAERPAQRPAEGEAEGAPGPGPPAGEVEERPFQEALIERGGEKRLVSAGGGRRMIELLRANYRGAAGTTILRELVQNALDSVRGLRAGAGAGAIEVILDEPNRTVTVKDNGIGISEEVAKTALVEPGESYKPVEAESTGRFGLAKAAVFGNADEIEIESVYDEKPPTGPSRRMRLRITGSGEDWIDRNKGLLMKGPEAAPPAANTGATVRIKIGPEANLGDWREAGDKIIGQSNLPAKIRVGVRRADGNLTWSPATQLAWTLRDERSIPGATLRVYEAGGPREVNSTNIAVLNNGLFQFNTWMLFTTGLGQEIQVKIPLFLAVDVIPSGGVTEGGELYPFTIDRDALKSAAEGAVKRAVSDLYAGAEIEAQRKALEATIKSAVPLTASRARFSDGGKPEEPLLLHDGTQTPGVAAILAEAATDASFGRLAEIVMDAHARVVDIIAESGTQFFPDRGHLRGFGVSTRWKGLALSKSVVGSETRAILLNPWASARRAEELAATFPGEVDRAEAFAFSLLMTDVHEIAHMRAWEHGEKHTLAIHDILDNLGPDTIDQMVRDIAGAAIEGDAYGRLIDQSGRIANAIAESGREDLLGKHGSESAIPERERPGRAPAQRVEPRREPRPGEGSLRGGGRRGELRPAAELERGTRGTERELAPEPARRFRPLGFGERATPPGAIIPPHDFDAPLKAGAEPPSKERLERGTILGQAYRSYVAIDDLPDVEPFYGNPERLRPASGRFPAIVVHRDRAGRLAVMGGRAGTDLLALWRAQNMTHVPAWVVDESGAGPPDTGIDPRQGALFKARARAAHLADAKVLADRMAVGEPLALIQRYRKAGEPVIAFDPHGGPFREIAERLAADDRVGRLGLAAGALTTSWGEAAGLDPVALRGLAVTLEWSGMHLPAGAEGWPDEAVVFAPVADVEVAMRLPAGERLRIGGGTARWAADLIADTIIHELAHQRTAGTGHGPRWQAEKARVREAVGDDYQAGIARLEAVLESNALRALEVAGNDARAIIASGVEVPRTLGERREPAAPGRVLGVEGGAEARREPRAGPARGLPRGRRDEATGRPLAPRPAEPLERRPPAGEPPGPGGQPPAVEPPRKRFESKFESFEQARANYNKVLEGIERENRTPAEEQRVPRSVERQEYPGFPDPAMEAEFEGARLRPIATKERALEFLAGVAGKFRDFPDLPHKAEFAKLRAWLHRHEKDYRIVARETEELERWILAPLPDANSYWLFSRKIVLQDLAESVLMHRRFVEERIGRGESVLQDEEVYRMPPGFTADGVDRALQHLNRWLAAKGHSDVIEALRRRRKVREAMEELLYWAFKQNGLDMGDKLARKEYFHHQVLDFALARQSARRLGAGRRFEGAERRGYWRRRKGSERSFVMDYLQADFDATRQMLLDVRREDLIRRIQDEYDAVPRLKIEAAKLNDARVMDYFRAIAAMPQPGELFGPFDPEAEARKAYRLTLNQTQAIALDKLKKLASEGDLPYGENDVWGDVVEALSAQYEADAEAKELSKDAGEKVPPDDMIAELFPRVIRYAAWVLKNYEGPATGAAGMLLKGINAKRRMIREILAAEKAAGRSPGFVKWRDLIPADTHEGYQIRDGIRSFWAYSIPEKLAREIMTGALSRMLDKSEVRRLRAIAGPHDPAVLPIEVARTLRALGEKTEEGHLRYLLRVTQNWGKRWMLSTFRRAYKYNLRNLTGDAEGVFLGNPKVFLKSMEAGKQVWRVLVRGKPMTREMRRWYEMGGLDSTLQATDIDQLPRKDAFRRFFDEKETAGQKIVRWPKRELWDRYWRTAELTADVRESILRYAAFLHYREQMLKNKKRLPDNFGASMPEEVLALDDVDERAYMLSNQLLGAYDETTHYGVRLSRYAWPFWRFQETALRRPVRLMKNAWNEKAIAVALGKKAGHWGKFRTSAFVAYRIGRFMLTAALFWALSQAINLLVWPECEEGLPEDVRARPHIIWWCHGDKSAWAMTRLGFVGEFLEWFGMDTPAVVVNNYMLGRRTLLQSAQDIAMKPANKFVGGLNFFWKSLAEGFVGETYWPDIREPRPIRDTWLYWARQYALEPEYRAGRGLVGLPRLPQREGSYAKTLLDIFAYRYDLGEVAYNEMQDNIYTFKREVLKIMEPPYAPMDDPKALALYWWRYAVKVGDAEAAETWREQYILKGGTIEGLRKSAKSLHPLARLKPGRMVGGVWIPGERQAFLEQLTPEEWRMLDRADEWYREVILGLGPRERTPVEPEGWWKKMIGPGSIWNELVGESAEDVVPAEFVEEEPEPEAVGAE